MGFSGHVARGELWGWRRGSASQTRELGQALTGKSIGRANGDRSPEQRGAEAPGGGNNVSRLGQRSSHNRSHVASLIVPVALLVFVVGVCAEGGPAGLVKLAGPLRALATGTASDNLAGGVSIDADGLAQVEVLFHSRAEAFSANLAQYGAEVQFRREARVQASVPVRRLLEVAALPQVVEVAPPAEVIPCQGFGPVVSEAVQITNASAMYMAGFRGMGARVAIIDLGFAALDTAEAPVDDTDPTQLLSLRTDRSTTAGAHGTAMAEHVADMAPDASLTLIAVDTPMSIAAAIDYVVARGFNIALMALVVLDGPFDGTHFLAQAVDSANAAGVFWVQAAGNFAQRHWAGTFTDDDHNNIHEFAPGTEDMAITVVAGGQFTAYLSWFETAGPTTAQDYDMVLYDGLGTFVAQSAYSQTGSTPPREVLSATLPAGDTYNLQIVRIGGDPTQLDTFKFYFRYPTGWVPPPLQVPESSIATPAEAAGAFTVGAVRGTNVDVSPYTQRAQAVDTLEDWSGQGPALSGLLKPDLVAPDACRTSLESPGTARYDPDYFEWLSASAFGTSFAAAHVAGAAALLYSEDSTRTADAIRDALIRLAVPAPPPLPADPPLPNPMYGNGRLSLRVGTDVASPTVEITYPRSGASITTTEPLIAGYLWDVGSGIDPTTIVLTLDGQELMGWIFDGQSGVLTYMVTPPNHAPLSRSSHRITLDASDRDGNAADQAVSSFRVSPPSIDAGLHMISIPYGNLTDLRPSWIFGLPAEQVLVVRWLPTDTQVGDKYHWWGGPTGVEDLYASFDPLDAHEPPYVVSDPPAGLGYFLSIPSAAILNVSGASLSGRVKYEIKLSTGYSDPRGWNMIGCPFENAVTWGGVQFVTNGVRQDLRDAIDAGVTDGVLFELKRAGGSVYYDFPPDPLAGSLQPWKGYWLRVLKDTTLVVYNSAITGQEPKGTERAEAKAPTEGEWLIRFGAVAAGGQDPANYIGVAPSATDAYDIGQDVPEPPALASPVRVYMPRQDWAAQSGQYAKDVRGALGTGQEWDVIVECAEAGADVTLTWPELNATAPAGISLVLRDLDAGRDIFMRTVAGYTYRSVGEESARHLRIVATPAGDRALVLTSVTALQAPDGTVQLSYSVSSPADVSVDILNISGRTISRLGSSTATAGGTETVAWNGRNSHGAKAPAGKYLVRVTARSENGQVAHAVRTFQVRR